MPSPAPRVRLPGEVRCGGGGDRRVAVTTDTSTAAALLVACRVHRTSTGSLPVASSRCSCRASTWSPLGRRCDRCHRAATPDASPGGAVRAEPRTIRRDDRRGRAASARAHRPDRGAARRRARAPRRSRRVERVPRARGRARAPAAVWVEQARAGAADDAVAARASRSTRETPDGPGGARGRAPPRRTTTTSRACTACSTTASTCSSGSPPPASVRCRSRVCTRCSPASWPDPAARTMADLDVLVDAEHATRAYDLLLAAGYAEHPDPIGEHADHHLPMLSDGDVTVELHVEPLVSRWRALVPADRMLRRAMYRPTERGVAAARRRHRHLRAPGRARAAAGRDARAARACRCEHCSRPRALRSRRSAGTTSAAGFEAAGVAHVLDAHLHATRHWFRAEELPEPSQEGARRAAAHTRLVELGVAEPALRAGWTYAVRVPRSFTAERMHAEFGRRGRSRWRPGVALEGSGPARGAAGGSAAHSSRVTARAVERGTASKGETMILEGKTVVVTGVGPGLGGEVAKLVLRDGGNVVLAARTADKLAAIAEELDPSGERVAQLPTDIGDVEQCRGAGAARDRPVRRGRRRGAGRGVRRLPRRARGHRRRRLARHLRHQRGRLDARGVGDGRGDGRPRWLDRAHRLAELGAAAGDGAARVRVVEGRAARGDVPPRQGARAAQDPR